MMLPFGRVVVLTQAHGYIGVTALIITTDFHVIVPYYLFSVRCLRHRTSLLLGLSHFRVRLWIPAWFKSLPTCGLSFDTA